MTNLPPPTPAPTTPVEQNTPRTYRFTVNGAPMQFRAPLKAREERDLRSATGYSLTGLFDQLQRQPGADLVAAFLWLCRRQTGATVSYDAVLDELDAMDRLEFVALDTVADPEHPGQR